MGALQSRSVGLNICRNDHRRSKAFDLDLRMNDPVHARLAGDAVVCLGRGLGPDNRHPDQLQVRCCQILASRSGPIATSPMAQSASPLDGMQIQIIVHIGNGAGDARIFGGLYGSKGAMHFFAQGILQECRGLGRSNGRVPVSR